MSVTKYCPKLRDNCEMYIYTCVCVYIYIYILQHISPNNRIPSTMCIYIFIYIHIMKIYIHIVEGILLLGEMCCKNTSNIQSGRCGNILSGQMERQNSITAMVNKVTAGMETNLLKETDRLLLGNPVQEL